MLFGSCTVCLNIFRVGYDVSHGHCRSQVEVVFPIIEIIFMGVQVIGLSRPRATRVANTHPTPTKPPKQQLQPIPHMAQGISTSPRARNHMACGASSSSGSLTPKNICQAPCTLGRYMLQRNKWILILSHANKLKHPGACTGHS